MWNATHLQTFTPADGSHLEQHQVMVSARVGGNVRGLFDVLRADAQEPWNYNATPRDGMSAQESLQFQWDRFRRVAKLPAGTISLFKL
jgi:hypothetical protein